MEQLSQKIINCKKCERLVAHRANVAIANQPKRLRGKQYCSAGVPGFGDESAKYLIVGLAPGLHGANRTGRPFTGDGAGILLYKSLFEMGWSNKPQAVSKDDGLILKNVFISNIVKCVPPKNIPNGEEKRNCHHYLMQELELLKNIKIVLALGVTSHTEILKIIKSKYSEGNMLKIKDFPFKHGKTYQIPSVPFLLADCYHPSTYNVNTGLLNLDMMLEVLRMLSKI